MADIDFLSLVDSCLSTNIRKLSRMITRVYDAQLEPAGTNINQLGILLSIQGKNQELEATRDANLVENEFITSNQIAKRLGMDNSTFSRNIRVLEDQGLIELIPSKINRKEKLIKIPEKGINLVLAAYPYWDELQNKLRDEFGVEKFIQTIKNLNELSTILSSMPTKK